MTAAAPSVGRSFTADDLLHHYVEYESPSPDAVPLILLHGLTSSSIAWSRVAERLAADYHVFALDQRGHGASDWAPADRYRTADYLADLEAFVDHLGLDRFILVGQSMGGHNTIAFAARHPERLICAVANDIPLYLERSSAPEAYEEQFPGGRHHTFTSVEAWIESRREQSSFTPDWAHQLQAEATLHAVEGGWQPKHDPQASIAWRPDDLREEATSIVLALLIVRGGRSHVLDAQTLQEMDMSIPGARSVTLEKAGHATYHDMFEEWVAVVGAFLAAHRDA